MASSLMDDRRFRMLLRCSGQLSTILFLLVMIVAPSALSRGELPDVRCPNTYLKES